jgi:hypothetical protein
MPYSPVPPDYYVDPEDPTTQVSGVHPLGEIDDETFAFVDKINASGGTMLGYGLDAGKSMFPGESSRPKVMLMVTDGDTEHGKNWYGDGIRLIAIGISTALNDTRINTLAKRNYGVAEFVYPGEDYGAVAKRITGFLSGPVLTDVEVDTKGDVVGVSDVFKGRPATIAIRFSGKPKKVRVKGLDPEGKKVSWEVSAADAKDCDFSEKIFARDYLKENQKKDAQVSASLRYGVICNHTSFVAVSLKEVPGKKPERVEIPVNLPAGWDWDSVFGASGGAKSICFSTVVGSPMRMRGGAKHLAPVLSEESIISASGPPTSKGPGTGYRVDPDDLKDIIGPGGIDIDFDVPGGSPTTHNFALDATDVVDRMVGVIVALLRSNRKGAEKAFKTIQSDLKAAKLNAEKRAMAYYFAIRLERHGLVLDEKVLDKLSKAPRSNAGAAAKAWYNLALKEEGRTFSAVDVPASHSDSGYIAWKFGKGSRPTVGEWSIVS